MAPTKGDLFTLTASQSVAVNLKTTVIWRHCFLVLAFCVIYPFGLRESDGLLPPISRGVFVAGAVVLLTYPICLAAHYGLLVGQTGRPTRRLHTRFREIGHTLGCTKGLLVVCIVDSGALAGVVACGGWRMAMPSHMASAVGLIYRNGGCHHLFIGDRHNQIFQIHWKSYCGRHADAGWKNCEKSHRRYTPKKASPCVLSRVGLISYLSGSVFNCGTRGDLPVLFP